MVRAREEGVRDQGKAAEVEKRAWIQGTFGGVCHNKCSDGDKAGRPRFLGTGCRTTLTSTQVLLPGH